jgi:WD40 repeat protein
MSYSPNGYHIVTGSDDKTIRIWDAETGAAVGEPLKGHTLGVWSVAYSPDGRHIISGSDDSTIRIWDAETGAAVGKPLEGHTNGVLSVAYSPDGRHIISGSDDSTIRIWDAETGAVVGAPLRGAYRTGCGLLLTLLMGSTSSRDPMTIPFESGMQRLVLQLANL